MNAATIRQLILDDPRPTNAYSHEVRGAVGRYAQHRRKQGARWTQIADEVGVSSTSARKWMHALEAHGFHQVVLVDDPPIVDPLPADELLITSPRGFTLTGCSLDQAIAVLQRLA